MSLLFKAELRGHKEPMAQVAFVMEDLKKGLSEEIMNLFRRKRINIGNIERYYKIPKKFRGSILNGRDITYKIIPDATFKFYVTASIFKRSQRRYKELKKLGKNVTVKDIVNSLKKRDKSDKNRGK